MEYIIACDSENFGVRDNKMKGDKLERGSSMGNGPRVKLADISNLPQGSKRLSQVENLKSASLTTNEYIEQLRKENITLMKVLQDRNKIIELSGIELQKLRINLQKLQQQNLQLAQANSQMLAELNSGKDRLKALHHELGCKNALLCSVKLELEQKTNLIMSQLTEKESKVEEMEMVKCDEAGESCQANKGDNKPCTTNRRQSGKQSLVLTTSKPVDTKEKIDNERHSLRRRSERFRSEEPDATEALSEEPELDLGRTTVKTLKAKENKRYCLRRESEGLKPDEPEPTKDLPDIDDSKPIEAEEMADNKRLSLRRQSFRFKSEEPEAIGALSQDPEPARGTSRTTNVKPHKAKERKRHCKKRRVVRVKSEECEPTEDLFEVDDTNFPVPPLCDNLEPESLPTSTVKTEDEERNSIGRDQAQELTRLSVGRPSRRAAVKVQSYKEIPLNVKMRRTE